MQKHKDLLLAQEPQGRAGISTLQGTNNSTHALDRIPAPGSTPSWH